MYIALLTPAVIMVIDRLIRVKPAPKRPPLLKIMESDMSVTVTRDGIVRPQPQDIRVETAMQSSSAHKTMRPICCHCRMAR
jgi:hypothetical protein